MKHVHKPLKCSSKICQLTPSNACLKKKLKFLSRNSCTFKVGRAAGDGISGYYMRDVVYFETDKMIDEFFSMNNITEKHIDLMPYR